MKKVFLLLFFLSTLLFAQTDSLRPANSIYKNFRPFTTPRTNYRPGTVYRIDKNGVQYVVQDVSSIKSFDSEEGDVTGRMTFTREELLEMLSIDFDTTYITSEVELKDVVREFTEQTTVDNILWENDLAENLVVDPNSVYYIVRETISTKEITFKFDKSSADKIVSGKGYLKEKTPSGDQVIDYPFSITKKFKEPKRLLYLDQKIGLEPYGN